MRALFVHNNFPAQFKHLAPALLSRGWDLRAIGSPTARAMDGIPLLRYQLNRGSTEGVFPLAVRWEADAMRGAAVAAAADRLRLEGFQPDLIVGHVGWGETLFLKDVWPNARSLLYAEFFVRAHGLDVGFDPEFGGVDPQRAMRVRAKNPGVLMALAQAEAAVAPTSFQRDTFPELVRDRIAVCHDGIDTAEVRPRPGARFALADGTVLSADDEVVTYLNRYLEPLRGLHVLLRALPDILARRPRAHVVILGQDHPQPYGQPPPRGKTWREIYLDELGDRIDLKRVHFHGLATRSAYLDLLAISKAHIYLTYPFVLSWSLLEAMSAGCVIIASDTAPVREVLTDGENARLIDFFDRDALVERCVAALAAPDAHRALGAAARKAAVQGYDLSTVCLPKMVALAEAAARA
jgi:glycosyltransferase involved in cell wall biosynthesis